VAKHDGEDVGGDVGGDAIFAAQARAIDEMEFAGRDGVFREKSADSAAAAFPGAGHIFSLRCLEGLAEDFAEGFGEEVLAVFVEAEEQVFHGRVVDGDEFWIG